MSAVEHEIKVGMEIKVPHAVIFGKIDKNIAPWDDYRRLFFTSKKEDVFTPNFNKYLKKTLSVSGTNEMVEILGGDWTLGFREDKTEKNEFIKTLWISVIDFKKYVAQSLKAKQSNMNSQLNSVADPNIVTQKADKVFDFLEDDTLNFELARIDNERYTDLIDKKFSLLNSKNKADHFKNVKKMESKNAYELGLEILSGDFENARDKITGVTSRTKEEKIWEKYIEQYKDIIFIGYNLVESQVNIKEKFEYKDEKNFPDFILVNDLGFPEVIELKLSSMELFVWDSSHDKFKPSANLSSAISQVANYMRIIGIDEKGDIEEVLGIRKGIKTLAKGTVIIGNLKQSISFSTYEKLRKEMSDKDIEDKIFQELLSMNYNLSNISVITYDSILKKINNNIN